MGKTLKYVKDFDFNEKPCNYSCGGMAEKSNYKSGGKVSKPAARRRVPVAPPQPALNRLAAAANAQAAAAPQAPMGLKKGGAAKMKKVMGEFKSGELRSGSKEGPVVKNRKQAIAIAMSEARQGKNKA